MADAFFQTGGSTGAVNYFPVIGYDSDSETWSVEDGSGERRKGCLPFVREQDRLLTSAATGHYLVEEGGSIVLKSNTDHPLPSRVSGRSAATYGTWGQKGTEYEFSQWLTSAGRRFGGAYHTTLSSSSAYSSRVDTRTSLAMASGLSNSLVYP